MSLLPGTSKIVQSGKSQGVYYGKRVYHNEVFSSVVIHPYVYGSPYAQSFFIFYVS